MDTQHALAPWSDKLLTGDCLDLLPKLPARSVDLVLADLPYGTTRNRWDTPLDLPRLWGEYERIIKPKGAIVLTAAQPFTATLMMSNQKLFRYELIWQKTVASCQFNIHYQPLRTHESVLVFYKRAPTYNPQMGDGKPYKANRRASSLNGGGYGPQRDHEVVNDGSRSPTSVLRFSNPRIPAWHPTQKPVPLFEYLIRTYSNPGDVILDNVLGSGTTAVAAINTGRHFVGMETDETYVAMARRRVAEATQARAAANELDAKEH